MPLDPSHENYLIACMLSLSILIWLFNQIHRICVWDNKNCIHLITATKVPKQETSNKLMSLDCHRGLRPTVEPLLTLLGHLSMWILWIAQGYECPSWRSTPARHIPWCAHSYPQIVPMDQIGLMDRMSLWDRWWVILSVWLILINPTAALPTPL